MGVVDMKAIKVFILILISLTALTTKAEENKNYREISAYMYYLECMGDFVGCSNYIAGFVQTVNMVFKNANKKNAICGLQGNIPHEFMEEVKNNSENSSQDTSEVLLKIIKKFHSCQGKNTRQEISTISAGYLHDICRNDVNFCSYYIFGFTNAVGFLAKKSSGRTTICANLNELPFRFVHEVELDSQNRLKNAIEMLDKTLSKYNSC